GFSSVSYQLLVINLSFYPPGAVAVTTRPHIYYCRSPNMEVFTCWWHPLDNNSESDDNITYSLTYSLEYVLLLYNAFVFRPLDPHFIKLQPYSEMD
uniref:Growth hormone receptor n=1 Tax=Oncorhynchus tshawytscha TaxID=74940 RepID=A0AAZ3SI98_ONCTS